MSGTAASAVSVLVNGSEIVRITVDRDEAARAVPHIREKLDKIDLENIRAMEQAMELGEKIRKENAKIEEERFEDSKKNSEKLVDAYSKQMDEIQKQMKSTASE